MQPPHVSPTIFFLFDFIKNTYSMFKTIDIDQFRSGDKTARDKAQEVYSRNQFANTLVNDRSGKLAAMTGGDPVNPADFGDEIRRKVKGLIEI